MVAGVAAFAMLGGPVGLPAPTARVLGAGDETGGGTKTVGPWPTGQPGDVESSAAAMSARERVLSRIAGHLIAETVPPGATVWVDGVMKCKTFADIVVGPASHRIVLTAPGYRRFREVMYTGRGAIIRRNLVPAPSSTRGTGLIRVECQADGKYAILVDDEEIGLLCPSLQVPAAVGKHMVGIYLPGAGRVISVEVTVELGAKPALAKFTE